MRTAARFDAVMDEFDRILLHLLLTDVVLPCYYGLCWCRKIWEYSQVLVIFISSWDDEWDKIMAIAQGGDDHIEKSLHLEMAQGRGGGSPVACSISIR